MKYVSFGILVIFAAVFLIPGVYHIYIGLLCRKEENLHWTLGKRVYTKNHKNVYEPGTWQRKKLAHYTHFAYEYTVDGKAYTLQGASAVAPGRLPNTPRIIYLKKSPRFAKIKGVWDFQALPMGLFMTFGGFFFGSVAILSLFL